MIAMQKETSNQQARHKGFTLIELSIVLIIIGLLVGGILVGQDLIAGAKVRSQINQIRSYDTAFNTFKLKYDATPGDCANCGSAGFGLRTAATGVAASGGDGDGSIEGDLTGTQTNTVVDDWEASFAFVDLSGAGLVDGLYDAEEHPEAKIGLGHIALVGGAAGNNYFVIGAVGGVATAGALDTVCATTACLTPFTAWQIDAKMDDGIATTGTAFLIPVGTDITTGATWDDGTPAADTDCVGNGAGGGTLSVYFSSDSTTGDCPMVIRTTL